VDLAGPKRQRDSIQRNNPWEAPRNVDELEQGGGIVHKQRAA
jgi:hypothetical protein